MHETKEGKIQEKSRKNLGNMHCDFFAATGAGAAFNALKTKAQQKADAAIRLTPRPLRRMPLEAEVKVAG